MTLFKSERRPLAVEGQVGIKIAADLHALAKSEAALASLKLQEFTAEAIRNQIAIVRGEKKLVDVAPRSRS